MESADLPTIEDSDMWIDRNGLTASESIPPTAANIIDYASTSSATACCVVRIVLFDSAFDTVDPTCKL